MPILRILRATSIVLLVAIGAPAAAQTIAGFENYRSPAGRMEGGTLLLSLEATEVAWRPWGEDGLEVRVNAFAAGGSAPRVPGPLIRVTAGTPVHVTVRNSLVKPLIIRGLRDRGQAPGTDQMQPAFRGDSLAIAPGETGEVRFTPNTPGTFFYYGRAIGDNDLVPPVFFGAERGDGPFVGVLVVDPPGTVALADEEIFLITKWMDRSIRASWDPEIKVMINGRSWPYTQRLSYTVGDSVRWRVINASGAYHPMHLHGFFFRVDARGDQSRETAFPPDNRRLAVTEQLLPAETMRVTWVPTEPGNWIFHCHLMRHMSRLQASPGAAGAHAHEDSVADSGDAMGGMVVGITVKQRPGALVAPEAPRRRLHLYTSATPNFFGNAPAFSFILQDGSAPPALDSLRVPGSPIILTRGEPSEIVVHNRLAFPIGVHWHGLELESFFDGVPDWSGSPGGVRPAVAPGDSFVVRMTPPRAGTFMYHVHSESGHELSQGLHGPFLVMEPGQRPDPETDRFFMLASLGGDIDPDPTVNGVAQPPPMELHARTQYRFRFAHISPNDIKVVSLLSGEQLAPWRVVAKDGADLPFEQARVTAAPLTLGVGETYDALWSPRTAGDYILRVTTRFPTPPPPFRAVAARPPHSVEIPIRVR